jgi:hypothetical protein
MDKTLQTVGSHPLTTDRTFPVLGTLAQCESRCSFRKDMRFARISGSDALLIQLSHPGYADTSP